MLDRSWAALCRVCVTLLILTGSPGDHYPAMQSLAGLCSVAVSHLSPLTLPWWPTAPNCTFYSVWGILWKNLCTLVIFTSSTFEHLSPFNLNASLVRFGPWEQNGLQKTDTYDSPKWHICDWEALHQVFLQSHASSHSLFSPLICRHHNWDSWQCQACNYHERESISGPFCLSL